MPAEGSIFDVSPDLPGFSMRPAGVGLQLPDITQPPPSTYGSFNDPFFGAPIAFAQCHKMQELDNIFPDQSAVPTVLASGVSPDSIPWSTAEDIIRDISREGPFDASATPMDTEDSPLISTGLPNDILHGESAVGCRRDVWVAAPPPPVLRIYWSAGVGKIIESLTVVLGEPSG